MRMRSAALSVLGGLVSLSLFAESADLKLSVHAPEKIRAALRTNISVGITNNGPDRARDVKTVSSIGQPYTWGDVEAGRTFGHSIFIPPQPPLTSSVTVDVRLTSATPDPDPNNNQKTVTMAVSTAPDLIVGLTEIPTLDPAETFPLTVSIENLSYFIAHDVELTLELPPGSDAERLPSQCALASGIVTCTLAEVGPTLSNPPNLISNPALATKISMSLIAPSDLTGGSVSIKASVRAREEDFDEATNRRSRSFSIRRTFLVTSTANDGSGSLRQAIRDTNAKCFQMTPCAINFRIDEPSATPWKTIRITSPLPPLVLARVATIDGQSQARAFGDRNPDGPEIEISGGGTTEGDGLTIAPRCSLEVAGLAINGFRGNGMRVVGAPWSCFGDFPPFYNTDNRRALLHDLYVGTDPTGAVAKPNGLAGVSVHLVLGEAAIRDSVLSGNTRSGLFVDVTQPMTIERNRIGVAAHGDTPLPNGASGIYFGVPSLSFHRRNLAVVNDNVIAFNAQFGIALKPLQSSSYDISTYVSFARNRIWGHANDAIDVGLDGLATGVDVLDGILPPPIITSARYDAVAQTTYVAIDLPFEKTAFPGHTAHVSEIVVELFASDWPGARGTGEAQRFVKGEIVERFLPTSVVLTVPGDLTGHWLTASVSREHFDIVMDDTGQTRRVTTELSAPVLVRR